MKAIIENGDGKHSFWEFKGQADYVDSWFFMSSPYLPLLIIAAYQVFVLKVGPAYMKGREPVELRNVLVAYNAFQVLVSMYLFSLGLNSILQFGVFHRTCLFEQEDIRKEILSGSYWYLMAKVTELLDTVFFVLRKKQNQVTFLHVYHHTFTMTISWLLVKYGKTDDLIFIGTLNSFVHIIMYGYYGLSVFPGIAKYLWWKKYLTKLQLIQFILVLVQIPINSITSKCPPSKIIIILVIFNGILFLYLFSDFYAKSYLQGKKEKTDLGFNKEHLNKPTHKLLNGHGNKSKRVCARSP